MGENVTTDVKTLPAPVSVVVEKPTVKPVPTKDKKRHKKTVAKPESAPHVTGRLMLVEISANGLEFTVKGKKGKAEVFSLKGMDASALPAAAAMLATLLERKSKLRVEYTISGDSRSNRAVILHLCCWCLLY